MKKKTFTVILAALLGMSALWGCSSGNAAGAGAEPETVQSDEAGESEVPLPGGSEAVLPDESETAPPGGSEAALPDGSEAVLPDLTGHTLMIYCGAGMTKPFQEIAGSFKADTGCEMDVTYANAGQIQSQITTSEEGDMFVAGSGDELTPVESYVAGQKDLVKHIPVLAVQSGNPKGISGLSGLAGDEVRLIMGDVDSTPIGKIAKKSLTDAGIFDRVQIEATTATAPQMSTAIAAGEADAAIVWKENCDVKGVEIVDTKDLDQYIKTIPAASLNCSGSHEALDAFNSYLDTDAAKEIWMKYGYEIVE